MDAGISIWGQVYPCPGMYIEYPCSGMDIFLEGRIPLPEASQMSFPNLPLEGVLSIEQHQCLMQEKNMNTQDKDIHARAEEFFPQEEYPGQEY